MDHYWRICNGLQTRKTKRWGVQFLVVCSFINNMDCSLILGWIISLKIAMLQFKKLKLQRIVNQQFGNGINKVDLMRALEQFINEEYPEKRSSIYLTKRVKSDILDDLAKDIKIAGGLDSWKKKLLLLGAPVVGSLPPKKKKKE